MVFSKLICYLSRRKNFGIVVGPKTFLGAFSEIFRSIYFCIGFPLILAPADRKPISTLPSGGSGIKGNPIQKYVLRKFSENAPKNILGPTTIPKNFLRLK